MTPLAGMRCVAAALALSCAAQAQAQVQTMPAGKASAAPGRSTPFRQEEDFAGQLTRVGIGLVLALGIGVVALGVYKRLVAPQMTGRRLRLLETLRLGPKSTLFLVELDGATLLIGQHGDALALLQRPTPQQAN